MAHSIHIISHCVRIHKLLHDQLTRYTPPAQLHTLVRHSTRLGRSSPSIQSTDSTHPRGPSDAGLEFATAEAVAGPSSS